MWYPYEKKDPDKVLSVYLIKFIFYSRYKYLPLTPYLDHKIVFKGKPIQNDNNFKSLHDMIMKFATNVSNWFILKIKKNVSPKHLLTGKYWQSSNKSGAFAFEHLGGPQYQIFQYIQLRLWSNLSAPLKFNPNKLQNV